MSIPPIRTLDEALAFLGALTPANWAAFRLGLGTLAVAVAVTGLAVWVALTVRRARRG